MSSLLRIAIVPALVTFATLLSSGCCTMSPCGLAGGGYAGGPSCGVANYGGAGCDSCGGAPAGCGLGLGCIGKLFSIADYGCTGCASGSAGCGETYYHDWISDPPYPNSCDGQCGVGCDSCGVGPTCGAPDAFSTGATFGGCGGGCGGGCSDVGCGGGCGGDVGRTAFQVPGRALYSTWTGVGGFVRSIRQGFLPSCNTCNAFSFSNSCGGCGSVEPGCGCELVGPTCGCAGTEFGGGCSSCGIAANGGAGVGSGYVGGPQNVGSFNVNPSGNGLAGNRHRIPHEVVTRQIRTAHNRPPHKVLANRLR